MITWMRFRRNSIGMVALAIILFAVLVSILGYLITPDSTPYSNTQILEISTQKPGFSVDMLLVQKDEMLPKTNIFHKMLFGAKSNYTSIPVSSYGLQGDSLLATMFDPDGIGEPTKLALPDIIFPEVYNLMQTGDQVSFGFLNQTDTTVSLERLQQTVKNKHINNQIYWLGTDQFGRDLLSRLIIGTRVSLSVGAISVSISLILGILLGSLAGYFGKRTDQIIMWFINVVWSIPTLLLVIALTFALGRGFWQIFIAVGLTMWVEVARVVRGQILGLREKEFIEAGYALGYSHYRILTRHIIPNILSPVIVISAANFASAILIEAGLSFLGIGVQPPMPSWGSMVKEYYSFIILDSAYLAIIPGLAIVVLVLAFMALGNALQDALDVRL
ncbi:MAG: peptide transporter [Bacteroidetes bacterium HGW-Bacteroidetes-16]|nr:MAG: peptide transporter [Bacteroidetes bacterium HGW-Bacteroidetes-16]